MIIVRKIPSKKTWGPIAVMQQDDPVILAKYSQENNLLDEPGWKKLLQYVKSSKSLNINLKQARMFVSRTA